MTASAANHTAAATTRIGAQSIARQRSHGYRDDPATREEFTAWLTASCQCQALPVAVTGHATLAAVAALLR
jgi:hypothetical protein